jgi:hypothetical protein
MILSSLGYQLAGTPGTAAYYNKHMQSALMKDQEHIAEKYLMKVLAKPEDGMSRHCTPFIKFDIHIEYILSMQAPWMTMMPFRGFDREKLTS